MKAARRFQSSLQRLGGTWSQHLRLPKGEVLANIRGGVGGGNSSYLGECFGRKASQDEDDGCGLHVWECDDKTEEVLVAIY